MDDIFTSDLTLTEKVLKLALRGERFPKPSANSMEFIRNFAHNFRICKDVQGGAQELILN